MHHRSPLWSCQRRSAKSRRISFELSQNLRQAIRYNNGLKNLILRFLPQPIILFISPIVIPFSFHSQALFTSFVSREVMDGLSLILKNRLEPVSCNFVSRSFGEFCLAASIINSTQSIQLCCLLAQANNPV